MPLASSFFQRDVLDVAPELLGKLLCRKLNDGSIQKLKITDVEAYRGEEDLACHASKGRTKRTEVMYWNGGFIYVYLIYGIHHMLNFVCSNVGDPQAILIRGLEGIDGPGRVAKQLQITRELNQQNLENNTEIWIEDTDGSAKYKTEKRIGIDYAGDYWKNKAWRFILQ